MAERKTDPANADHDAVMSWLQDRELKDRKLAEARSGVGGSVGIAAVIQRMQVKAHATFPNIEQSAIDGFVRKYVLPEA